MSVKIYTTPTCSYCNSVKTYLRQKGISFSEVDVSKNQTAADEMVRKSNQYGVPVIDANGKIIVGFNKPALDRALNIT
ncbi:glutathione S-transferase N-terminal domain-containing protein [candidate division WOR-3 bacterium]|nr:glutathione S-transferase N-terminal domain-containing protein [candidate division WOR-3 bacterium]